MTQETITTFGVGIASVALIPHTGRDTNRALANIREDVAELRERMARLKALFKGFAGRKLPMAAE